MGLIKSSKAPKTDINEINDRQAKSGKFGAVRSARAWIYDETKGHKVTLSMAHVRTFFYGTITVKKLILPLHPDKRTGTPTTEPNYKMALNFLTEIALTAFITNDNGECPATTPAVCQDDSSGDLKPTYTSNKRPRTIPLGQSPFPWPDMIHVGSAENW